MVRCDLGVRVLGIDVSSWMFAKNLRVSLSGRDVSSIDQEGWIRSLRSGSDPAIPRWLTYYFSLLFSISKK